MDFEFNINNLNFHLSQSFYIRLNIHLSIFIDMKHINSFFHFYFPLLSSIELNGTIDIGGLCNVFLQEFP